MAVTTDDGPPAARGASIPVPCDQTDTTRPRGRVALWALVVLLVSFVVYVASPVRMETDSLWAVFTARSLVAHRDADLDEYRQVIRRGPGFQIEYRDGHAYYAVPLGTSLMAVPFVAVASLIDAPGLDRRLAAGHAQPLDGWIAAAIAAISCALMYLVASRLTARTWVALLTTATFAFGTQVWSTASRTLWMHGPSLVCLTLALLLAQRARRSGAFCVPLGAVLALAYFVRPTNAVPLLALAVWVAFLGRRPAVRFACGVAATTAVFLALDLALFGRILQPYFQASRVGVSATTVEALLGNLISPSRGLLVFVPVTLVCAYGFVLKRRAGTLTPLDLAIAASAVGYWLLVSAFPLWWAGWSYGPRFLTDIAPMLAWFLPPVLEAVATRRRSVLGGVLAVTLVLSVAIQARGSFAPSTAEWNWNPHDVGLDHTRPWDWSDPQFLR